MGEEELSRYAIVSCVVVGHRHYGLLVGVVDSELTGFVDSANIADPPFKGEDWPAIGDYLRGVVLGYTRTGQIRLTTRQRDVTFVESVPDPVAAFREWRAVSDAGAANVGVREEFYRSRNASALLKWAFKNSPSSDNRKLAVELLSAAPEELREHVLGQS